ncbi:MAG TPA: YcxB family protein [Anaerolineae bacterium]|nr:YcxB family protein [Anaerolineae bacterium]
MISFGGTYTRQQWSRGIRLAMHPTGWALVTRLLALAIALAGLALIVFTLVRGEDQVSRIVRLAITIAVLAYWALTPYVRAWREARRPWRQLGSVPSLRGVVSGEGILSNASAASETEKWDSFLRARVRDDLVVLLGSNSMATILPREFFASEDDWQGFRLLVDFNVVRPK